MKLIDADKWINKLETQMNDKDCPSEIKDYNQLLINEINLEPTAYDVDKVVEQLEDKALEHAANGQEYGKDGYDRLEDDEIAIRQGIEEAIEIVKSGVIE